MDYLKTNGSVMKTTLGADVKSLNKLKSDDLHAEVKRQRDRWAAKVNKLRGKSSAPTSTTLEAEASVPTQSLQQSQNDKTTSASPGELDDLQKQHGNLHKP